MRILEYLDSKGTFRSRAMARIAAPRSGGEGDGSALSVVAGELSPRSRASAPEYSNERSISGRDTGSILGRTARAAGRPSGWQQQAETSGRRSRQRHALGRTIGDEETMTRSEGPMPLTRDFRVTVLARARRDVRFCQALLTEAINDYLSGETAVGRSILRDLVNATIGFEELAPGGRQAEQEPATDARARAAIRAARTSSRSCRRSSATCASGCR